VSKSSLQKERAPGDRRKSLYFASRYQCDTYLDEDSLRALMARDVLRGLTSFPRFLPPRYFYDDAGVELFDQITRLPEYYLTRAECSILHALAPVLIKNVAPVDIVELGAGGTTKIRYLLDAFKPSGREIRYIPIDISARALEQSALELLDDYPWLTVHAIVGDFERELVRVPPPRGRRLAVFFGSTLGNLEAENRIRLLLELRNLIGPDGQLLIGLDLVKDSRILEKAYNDSAHVTAAFNRNILLAVNRMLKANFEPEAFDHLAFYNPEYTRVEMHLVSRCEQTVRVRAIELTVHFAPGDRIWTENCYKFTRRSVLEMFQAASMRLCGWFEDSAGQFALALAKVAT